MYEYRCTLLRVIDGDTVDVTVDLGFKIRHDMRIRLAGINAPERGKSGSTEATAYVGYWFKDTPNVTVRTMKDKSDSFGRYLGTFYNELDDRRSLNEAMLQEGHAEVYTR